MPRRSTMTSKQKQAAGMYKKNPSRRNSREPKVSSAKPPKPRGLPKHARTKWDYIVRILAASDILATTDAELIRCYCVTYHHWVIANDRVLKEGETIINGKGDMVAHPMLNHVHKFSDRLKVLLIELGLTPLARAKVHATSSFKDEDADPLKVFTA